jgi:hypothetical protein
MPILFLKKRIFYGYFNFLIEVFFTHCTRFNDRLYYDIILNEVLRSVGEF